MYYVIAYREGMDYDHKYDEEFVRDDIEENSKKYNQMFLNKLKEAFDKLVEARVEKVSLRKKQQKELFLPLQVS